MTNRNSLFAAIVTAFAASLPAAAAGEEIIITQAKAIAGNVTPGDAPGYPITLSKTGSYRLDGNLTPGAGELGIHITGAFVTLDMAGFTLNGSDKVGTGIYGGGNGARIENGTITRFKLYGIYGNGRSWTIENMLVTENHGYGIFLHGNGDLPRVLNSNISHNGGTGIYCYSCHLEGNVLAENESEGVKISYGAVLGNTFFHNKGVGIRVEFYVGLGNNTFLANNDGNNFQGYGLDRGQMRPNYCNPGPCP